MTYKITPSPERGCSAAHGALSRFLSYEVAIKREDALIAQGILVDVNNNDITVITDTTFPISVAWDAFDEVVYL